MYKNVKTKLVVLGPGKKCIEGAKEFVSFIVSKKTKHIVFGVGSNDLAKKETSSCVDEMKSLIEKTKVSHDSSKIHILPAFERVDEFDFNKKVKEFNENIKHFCETDDRCMFINNSIIYGNKPQLYSDGIHFSELGQKSLVQIIKTHLNPLLGLKPYGEYKLGPRIRQENNHQSTQHHSKQPFYQQQRPHIGNRQNHQYSGYYRNHQHKQQSGNYQSFPNSRRDGEHYGFHTNYEPQLNNTIQIDRLIQRLLQIA